MYELVCTQEKLRAGDYRPRPESRWRSMLDIEKAES